MYNRAFHKNDLSRQAFLVTGGAGFIGSNIVEYLVRFGAGRIRILDNLSTGNRENIMPFLEYAGLEFMEGDICDPEICMRACQGMDFVLHQAALGSVPRSVKDPIATNHANVSGFINMLVAAKDQHIKRFVYASSSSVYGDSPHLPKVEEQTGNPLSPYAVSKKVDELYASVFARTYGMEIVGLRYFNIFGPRQSPEGPYAAAIPLFMAAVLKNESPFINGDGEQSRDFTFVENAVEANIRALYCPAKQNNGEVFNIAVGDRTTVNQLFTIIRDTAGSSLKPTYRNERPGDIRHSLADISKAESVLEYNPSVNIRQGLEITFKWFKEKYFPHLS